MDKTVQKCHRCFDNKPCDEFNTLHYGTNYLCTDCQYAISANMYFGGCK